jgi:hypothetical protein
MTLIIYALIFSSGGFLGFLAKAWRMRKYTDTSGTMYVSKDDRTEKTVYSLELDEYPEKLQFKKVVVFKVNNSEENSDRS